jgi:hypothetical protein
MYSIYAVEGYQFIGTVPLCPVGYIYGGSAHFELQTYKAKGEKICS